MIQSQAASGDVSYVKAAGKFHVPTEQDLLPSVEVLSDIDLPGEMEISVGFIVKLEINNITVRLTGNVHKTMRLILRFEQELILLGKEFIKTWFLINSKPIGIAFF